MVMFLDVNSGSAGAILILTKQDERLSPASRLKDNLPGPSSLFFFSSRLIFCLSVRDPLILIQRARSLEAIAVAMNVAGPLLEFNQQGC